MSTANTLTLHDAGPQRRPTIVMLTADRLIDRRISREADALEAAGWDVTIVGMPVDPGTPEPDPRVVRIGSRVQVPARESFLLDTYRWVRRALPMNSSAMRRLKGFVWRHVVDQEGFYLTLFRATALEFKPDVFMAHDLPMLAVAREAAEAAGAKLVYDSHELYSEQEFDDTMKRRWMEIERRHIGRSDLTITVNPSIASELEKRYGLKDVRVIYSAEEVPVRDTDSSRLRQAIRADAHPPILLMQGGMSAGRNLDTLVEAMALVNHPSVQLVMLGDGAFRVVLERRVREMRLEARVHLLPAVPQSELLEWTQGADAGIIPYQATCLNNYYCTPNKLFEFIAARVPILGSDLPEIRRLVVSNDIGLVAPLSTAADIARSIDDFFGDETRLQRWRRRLEDVRRELSWEKEGAKLVLAFESLRR